MKIEVNDPISVLAKYPKLLNWLTEKHYFEYPAAKSNHGACYQGLVKHSEEVTKQLLKITNLLGIEWEREESPYLVGMLHDVCKLDDYEVFPINEEGTEIGIEYNKTSHYPGHGDKSLIMLLGLIDLTEEEKMCIRFHMGAFTDSKEWKYYSAAVKKYPNVLWTHTADMIASQILDI